jgi:CRISPR-associated protein Csm2
MEIAFYKEDEKVNHELFSTIAKEWAKKLAEEQERYPSVNKRTQFRQFYDEVLRLDAEVKRFPEKWDDILPAIHMLSAKAAYANGRKLVSKTFMTFIQSSIEKIDKPKDFQIFASFFEALMGFYRLYGPSN